MDTSGRRARTPRPTGGLALDYPRAGLSAEPALPAGWLAADDVRVVGAGVTAFDRLAELLLDLEVHRRAGMACRPGDPAAPAVLEVREGPLRGPCRLVETIDESLAQGLVVGTGLGNRARAEHRCVLGFDPDSGSVTARSRTVWHPGADHVLPGATTRLDRAHRRLLARLGAELGRAA